MQIRPHTSQSSTRSTPKLLKIKVLTRVKPQEDFRQASGDDALFFAGVRRHRRRLWLVMPKTAKGRQQKRASKQAKKRAAASREISKSAGVLPAGAASKRKEAKEAKRTAAKCKRERKKEAKQAARMQQEGERSAGLRAREDALRAAGRDEESQRKAAAAAAARARAEAS